MANCVADVLRPGQFFATPPLDLEFTGPVDEDVAWELFRGRALDHTQTRERRRFLAWHVHDRNDPTTQDEPLLSVKWDQRDGRLFVTRSILCRAWESYADDAGAIRSREAVRRVRELVGSVDLRHFNTPSDLRDELAALLFHAVVGTSRLPLTSVESPLPAFTLGQLGHFDRDQPGDAVLTRPTELIEQALSPNLTPVQRSRLLELVLRNWSRNDGERFVRRWRDSGLPIAELPALLRAVFNDVSLSPYTGVVGAAIAFLDTAVRRGDLTRGDEIDFLTHLLRQTGRHLTAFDLVRFHHRGANYPDALLLDEVLRRAADVVASAPDLVLPRSGDDTAAGHIKRLRRRGLRQAWLLRDLYRGHRVPDVPTSQGENARVWPYPHLPVPEEQILQPSLRPRRIFDADWVPGPAVREALQHSLADLAHPDEARELGMALFLDRPFGVGRHPAEPDLTLLFSYEAFSRRIALDRLQQLGAAEFGDRLASVSGVARRPPRPGQRPGAASLDDALVASDDFMFLRSTRRSVTDFLAWYDSEPLRAPGLADVIVPGRCLLLRSATEPNELVAYDAELRPRFALRPDLSRGYASRAGTEHPAAGLIVVAGPADVRLMPRLG